MAYANKYVIPFFDNFGNACNVIILQDGYVGATTELQPAATPCVLTYNGNVQNKIDTIITSELNIGFVKEVGDDFSEFYTSDEEYRVEVYKSFGGGADELQWKGIIIPDSYQEELQYPPIEIRLHAVCGLSRLKFYKYQIEDYDSGASYITKKAGVKKVAEYLAEILTKSDGGILGMEYFYSFFEFFNYDYIPIYGYGSLSFEHRFMFDASICYDSNNKALTYYELLNEICKFQQARCFQYKGEYYIISTPLYTMTQYGVQESFESRVLLAGGTVEDTTCSSDFLNEFFSQKLPLNKNNLSDGTYVTHLEIDITKQYNQDFIYALKDQIISYQAGIRNAQVTSKIDRGATMINNQSFDYWYSTDVQPEAWIDDTGGNIQRIVYAGNPYNTNYENQGSLISVGIDSSYFGSTPPTAGVTPYDFIHTIPSVVSQNAKFKFRFWFSYDTTIDTSTTIHIPFVVKVGAYYARPQSVGTSWTTTPYIWYYNIDYTNYTTYVWQEVVIPSTTVTSFFTNLDLGSADKLGGLEVGFYMPYLSGGTLSSFGTFKIDDVQVITPESTGVYSTDRVRTEDANEYGIFGFNNSQITGRIKYTEIDYLSNSVVDKDANNDITLLFSSFNPSNVRRSFFTSGGTKKYTFPNNYPAGSFIVDGGTMIYEYDGGWGRFSNLGEVGAGGTPFNFYYLYLRDLFRLYEKTMQNFQGTLYPYTASGDYGIINILVDNVNNNGIILLPSKLEIDYKSAFAKVEAFEIQGTDKVIGTIEIPSGNYVPPNDPDVGVE